MIIPSIDLSSGKAVQLRQGKKKVLENDHPISLAHEFSKFGEIAVVDLDAALESGINDAAIKEICHIAECRVGGGIRSIKKAKRIISLGAEKIIIGTKAFESSAVNHEFLKKLVSCVGKNRVIVAVDTLHGEIVTRGWRLKTGLKLHSVLKEIEPYVSEFLFTCVEKEGLMKGTDFEAVERLRASTDKPITVAGGVSTLEEIEKLAKLDVNIQLGMALYTGKISLLDAFSASLNWGSTLIPTIAIDTASQVLMLAYSSRESLKKTFETKKAWYYSRSRKQLWMKGETSGNIQNFLNIRTDCDGDALLMTVNQEGEACHKGSYSCFRGKEFSLWELYDVVNERISAPSPSSYTSKLTMKKLQGKILEEAKELVDSESKEDMIWEAADLLYFICVMLAKKGVPLEAVFKELKRRRKASKEND